MTSSMARLVVTSVPEKRQQVMVKREVELKTVECGNVIVVEDQPSGEM
jgi:hypothetical protein